MSPSDSNDDDDYHAMGVDERASIVELQLSTALLMANGDGVRA